MIWLIGVNGMLGRDVARMFEENKIEYVGTDVEVDITDLSVIEDYIENTQIDWIVNCAAYTAVDKAEDEPEKAEKLNIDGPRNLGIIADQRDARIIHISTDYVFGSLGTNLEKSRPLREDDEASPESVYGRTKLEGEMELQRICRRTYIVRIAWLYGLWGNNFVYTMLRLFKERGSVKVVEDQLGCPTWSRDVAALIRNIVESEREVYGIYHFCGGGRVSWYGFAREIAQRALSRGLLTEMPKIDPCTSDEFPSKAARPRWSVLSTDKTADTFGFSIPPWHKSLEQFMEMLAKQKEML
ncbi:MAG: dTDP-4-dehydrorhamnose reductase [Spirochaetaceae bacterium]|nr:dTDP-4-dehydrorhamnose reductase [Spirochaetaceae bacterium]MCF7938744.1 dTDP-4-dehydrorhamnose reductase [Spirochaetales bacterium]